jgi:hypothetical protein
METPISLLGTIKTRGNFRERSVLAMQERKHTGEKMLENPDHPIWQAWESIKANWPGPCTNWDDEPPVEWANAVSELKSEQLVNGIRNLHHFENENGSKSFPPSAGQFHDLCLNNFTWERQCHKMFTSENKLEDLTRKEKNKKTGDDTLSSLRGMFA